MYARSRPSFPLDEQRLLLNGLQPKRLSGQRSTQASGRPSKRQKTDGLNSRFDRMIQTVNAMDPSSAGPSRIQRVSRRRAASFSSTVTYDAPKKPIGANGGSDNGSLKQNLSLVKTKGAASSVRGHDPFVLSAFDDSDEPNTETSSTDAPPSWLKRTISTLEQKNPLRTLLPGTTFGLDSDSSPFGLNQSSETSANRDVEEPRFAFTTPTTSYGRVSPYIVSSHEGEHSPSRVFHIQRSAALCDSVKSQAVPTPQSLWTSPTVSNRLSIAAQVLPFSTPGPASTNSLLAQDQLSLTDNPAVDTDSGGLASFVPFSKPGPLHSTKPTHLYDRPLDTYGSGRDIISPALGSHRSCSPLWQSVSSCVIARSLAATENINLSKNVSEVTACTMPTYSSPALSPFLTPSRLDAELRKTPPPIFGFSSATGRAHLQSPSPRSSRSIKRFLFNLKGSPAQQTRLRHQLSSTGADTDYDKLGFKWERFDRSDIILDALSSSPRPVRIGSEEAFWEQSALDIPDEPLGAGRRPHTNSTMDSPRSLRLSEFSTPLACSPAAIQPLGAAVPTPESIVSSQKHKGSPFAWIVAPRDEPAQAASYTQSLPKTPVRYIRPPILDCSFQSGIASSDSHSGYHVVSKLHEESEKRERHFDAASPRRPPFAPAPGIYISPLQSETAFEKQDDNRNRDGRRADSCHSGEVRTKRPISPVDEHKFGSDPTKERVLSPNANMRRTMVTASHQDVRSSQDDAKGETVDQPIVPGVGTAREHDEMSDNGRESAEELLQNDTQESKSTIESWTD